MSTFVVLVEDSPVGFRYLEIRWTCGMSCRYDPLSSEFGQMFRDSGLIRSQLRQTFENYRHDGLGYEVVTAKRLAIECGQEQHRACAFRQARDGEDSSCDSHNNIRDEAQSTGNISSCERAFERDSPVGSRFNMEVSRGDESLCAGHVQPAF